MTTPAPPSNHPLPAAPKPSLTSNFQFVQGRSIPWLDSWALAPAEQVLSVDSSISDKPAAGVGLNAASTGQRAASDSSSSADSRISASVDRIFAGNDVEGMVWNIEMQRNAEFGNYLGLIANLPDKSVAIPTIQNTLNTISNLSGKRSAIIYVVTRPEQLELILVPPQGSLIRYSVPQAKKDIILAVASQLRDEVTNPRKRDTTSYLPAAQQLYQWMIAPLEKDLQGLGIETLLLSLDSGLRSLPVAALHDGTRFLIEKYSFSLIPSFSLTDTRYASIRDAEVLAMGASEFRDNQPLATVPMELNAIAPQLWPGRSFLNEGFTLANLQAQRRATPFQIVHLATHAEFQPGQLSNSYIELWNRKLGLDEMPALRWNDPPVELLVLSACRTALGNAEAELGFAGFAVKSGAKSVVASLWYVSDESTTGLMVEFYQQLKKAPIKAEALRQAQLAMISGTVRQSGGQIVTSGGSYALPANLAKRPDRRLAHPYYWSGFTVVGSPW